MERLTVVSRDHFGGRRYVNQFAVSPRPVAKTSASLRASAPSQPTPFRDAAPATAGHSPAIDAVPERRPRCRRAVSSASVAGRERRQAGRGKTPGDAPRHHENATGCEPPQTFGQRSDPSRADWAIDRRQSASTTSSLRANRRTPTVRMMVRTVAYRTRLPDARATTLRTNEPSESCRISASGITSINPAAGATDHTGRAATI